MPLAIFISFNDFHCILNTIQIHNSGLAAPLSLITCLCPLLVVLQTPSHCLSFSYMPRYSHLRVFACSFWLPCMSLFLTLWIIPILQTSASKAAPQKGLPKTHNVGSFSPSLLNLTYTYCQSPNSTHCFQFMYQYLKLDVHLFVYMVTVSSPFVDYIPQGWGPKLFSCNSNSISGGN